MPAQKKRRKPLAAAIEPDPTGPPVFHLPGTAVAELLVGAERSGTAVVVSYKADAGACRIDAPALARLLDGEAEVYELQNGAETLRLQAGLPEGLEVYGTGARVYPAGPGWPAATPEPRLVYPHTKLAELMQDLAADVRTAAHRIAPPSVPAAPKPAAAMATGTVRGFASGDHSRALVKLATTGELATIRAEDLLPGVPLDWLLTPGQQVSGVLENDLHTLDIRALLQRPGSPVTTYRAGDVALARVKSAAATHAVVSLWPGADFRIGVERISSNELDAAEDLLTEGEVVRVRVLYEGGAVVLSMLDVDDDDPHVPAPPLVAGGPPWLDLDRPYASIFAPPVPSAAADAADGTNTTAVLPGTDGETGGGGSGVVPGGEEPALTASERRTALKSTQMELEAARHTITGLLADADLRGATDRIARLWQDKYGAERETADLEARRHAEAERQLAALRAELARTKAKLVNARQQRRSAASKSDPAPAALFTDPVEQFGFDLHNEWARMVPAVDKAAEPLGEYTVGPYFLASLAVLAPPQRAKALRAVVDLVANREGPLRNRKPHVLRENEGAHAPARMRGDDACWRLYVEQGTAAALRLHYWKLKSGGFELHEVVPHDAVKP